MSSERMWSRLTSGLGLTWGWKFEGSSVPHPPAGKDCRVGGSVQGEAGTPQVRTRSPVAHSAHGQDAFRTRDRRPGRGITRFCPKLRLMTEVCLWVLGERPEKFRSPGGRSLCSRWSASGSSAPLSSFPCPCTLGRRSDRSATLRVSLLLWVR